MNEKLSSFVDIHNLRSPASLWNADSHPPWQQSAILNLSHFMQSTMFLHCADFRNFGLLGTSTIVVAPFFHALKTKSMISPQVVYDAPVLIKEWTGGNEFLKWLH